MKKWLIPVVAFTMILAGTITARAEWTQNANGYYYYQNNQLITNQIVDGEYYVDSTGRMVSDTWIQVNDNGTTSYYYFQSDGKMAKDKWVTIDGKSYHFDDNGKMQTGWILDNMYFCHYDNGQMLTGWQFLDDAPDTIDDSTKTGPNVGTDATQHYYYFGTNGKKYFAEEDDYVEKRIEGKRYAFDRKGAICTGWVKVNSDKEGIAAYKYFDQDGTDHVGWYSLQPPEELQNNYPYTVMWFYFNTAGVPVCDEDNIATTADIRRIGTKKYYFNFYGTPVWGLRKIWTSTSCTDYDTYFFGTMNQCNAQSGTFQLLDGGNTTIQYYFTASGAGYTGARSGYLFYKGKLQKADSSEKYACINIGGKNYMIGSSGQLQKSKTKLKDNDGNYWATDSSGVVTKLNDSVYTGTGRAPEGPAFEY